MERQIVIGLITNDTFLRKIRPIWDDTLIGSVAAHTIAEWAIEHFDNYDEPIGRNIEAKFYEKLENGLPKDLAEEIEEDILPGLSEEYTADNINAQSLFDQAQEYFKTRRLLQLAETIESSINNKNLPVIERIKAAETLLSTHTPFGILAHTYIDLGSKDVLKVVENAFTFASENVLKYPYQMGKFWNSELVRGGFIALMASEKRGKTFMLVDMAVRAALQKRTVVFFQAGDMNEASQLKRIGIKLSGVSDKEQFCKEHYEAVRDCKLHQLGECNCWQEEKGENVFDVYDEEYINDLTIEDLVDAYESCTNYRPCYGCKRYDAEKLGVPWVKKIPKADPLDEVDAIKFFKKKFVDKGVKCRLDTYANGTLSVKQIIDTLKTWEKLDNFIPDVIIIDYADLLVPSSSIEFRHQQNQIWKDLRGLSQTEFGGQLPLVITATQADAASYTQKRLTVANFSEDKRKYAHVTGMYGMNQDPEGVEKGIGLMCFNKLVLREDVFDITDVVYALQNLRRGQAFTGSFFSNKK